MTGDSRLVVRIQGVVLPTWTALVLIACLILASASAWRLSSAMRIMMLEVRVLQQHVMDVESVLLREGIAERKDLGGWKPPKHDEEKP